MKNCAVLEGMKRQTKDIIEIAFNKGYDQGYHDGKLDGEAEKIEELEKQFDDEKKAEYKRGYADGKKEVAAELNFEKGYDKGYEDGKAHVLMEQVLKLQESYNEGYSAGYKDAYEVGKKDGQKAERMLLHEPLKKDLEEAYQKGIKHGQELRAEEVKCAEACGMKRAWDVARKICDMWFNYFKYDANELEKFFELKGKAGEDVFELFFKKYSAKEAIAKLDEWEKEQKQEQEQSKKRCENCDHYCGDDNKFKCDIKGALCIERDRWTPKQDAPEMNVGSIAVWDEVEDNIGNRTVVTHIYSDDKYANADVIDADGCFRSLPLELLEKTGRRYCFQELLDTMKKNNVEEAETNENK